MTATIMCPYEVLISKLHKIFSTMCYCVTKWKVCGLHIESTQQ